MIPAVRRAAVILVLAGAAVVVVLVAPWAALLLLAFLAWALAVLIVSYLIVTFVEALQRLARRRRTVVPPLHPTPLEPGRSEAGPLADLARRHAPDRYPPGVGG